MLFELKHSILPIVILHDLNIEYEDYRAQIDFVIITHTFILVLEVKKLFGNVTVTSKGEFQRVITKNNRVIRKEGMYSPLNQAERHATILEKFLKANKLIKNVPVRFAVTFANPKTILDISSKAPSHIQNRVIRHDQIKTFLKQELDQDSPVSIFDDQVYEIAEGLVKANVEMEFNESRYLLTGIPQIEPTPITNEELAERLKEYRFKRAKEQQMKPFYIYTNKTLDAIVERRPKTIQELLLVEGIGPKKAEEYGKDIVAIVKGEDGFMSTL